MSTNSNPMTRATNTGTRAKRTPRVLLALASIAAGAFGLIGASATAAGATGLSTMSQSETLHFGPTTGSGGFYTAFAGNRVQMTCWTSTQYYDGSAKWFHIQDESYPYADGYVPANSVAASTQSIVGHC